MALPQIKDVVEKAPEIASGVANVAKGLSSAIPYVVGLLSEISNGGTGNNNNDNKDTRKGRGGDAGGSGTEKGHGGNGGSSGSGKGGDDFNKEWKKMMSESPCIATFGGRKLVQSEDEKSWYSKDTAGHGKAVFKLYEDKGSTLQFHGSLDAEFNDMKGKHESREGTFIKKKDLNIIKKKNK